jgi:DNA-binding NarL/FixJ family response regulator
VIGGGVANALVVVVFVDLLPHRQIAGALVITEWTVDTHVRHILAKLNLRSRAQVAAWAVERRLLFRELSTE